MLHVQAVVVLLLIEVAGVSLLALVVWAALAMRRRTRDRRAVETLVASIQAADAERRAGLTETLAVAGLSDDALEERVTTLLRAERQLYKTLIATYLARDSATFTTIDDSVSEALAPYRALILPPPESAGGEPSEPEDAQVESLRADNDALRDELETTRRTMGNMLNEYAQMYERGDGTAEGTTARTILSAGTSGAPAARPPGEPVDGEDPGAEALATFDGSLDAGEAPSTNLDDGAVPRDGTDSPDDGTDSGDPGDPGDPGDSPGDAAQGDAGDSRAA